MANIFLSIPILEKPEFKMIFSTYAAIQSCKDHKVRLFANENDSLISRVRNVHMSAFLNDYPECDYFICIDSDIELVNIYQTNNLLTKLISHDKDFVGGLYPLKQYKNKPTCASVPEGNIDRTEIPFDQGLLPMKWLSSGCWCIKRRVLEQMVKSYPELTYVGDDNMVGKPIHGLCIPEIFEIETEGKTFKKYLSEDWSFPVDPETKVLCAGFVNRKIKDIDIGETVIAFDESPSGQKRQLRFTQVEKKITKILPKVKITTETEEVITTADHKWLIKRGEKNRKSSRKGSKNGERLESPNKSYWEQTKNIQVGDYIYKPFRNISNDTINNDYRRGYLSGLWDGDGNVYKNKKWDSTVSSVRLTDLCILERCSEYLTHFGIDNKIKKNINIKYASYNPECHSKLHGITLCGSQSLALQEIIKITDDYDMMKGYLAGIFDSEGHYDGATINLSQYKEVNETIWRKIKRALEILRIPAKSDKKRHRITKCKNVHDFFMLTTPACTRKLHIRGQHKGRGNLIMPQYKEKVTSITPIPDGKVMCLVTETGTFIANGYASHNCERWKKIGGEIFADTSIVLNHLGKVPFSLWNVQVVSQPIVKEAQQEVPSPTLVTNLPEPGFDLEGNK